eukprot:GHVT01033455.1.p1 GENE.GHVT01033455.1~~GHVT01033455.1.p1  ORF type:complete len:243 (+),score=17.90 GHVT01033455.1:382-1110(+)
MDEPRPFSSAAKTAGRLTPHTPPRVPLKMTSKPFTMDEGLPTSGAARPTLRALTRLPSKITSKKIIKAPRSPRPKPDSRQFAYLLSAGVCCALLTGCSYAVYHSMKASRLARALPASTKDSFNGQAVATSLSNVPTREYNYPKGFNGSIHSLTPKLLPHTSPQAAALKSVPVLSAPEKLGLVRFVQVMFYSVVGGAALVVAIILLSLGGARQVATGAGMFTCAAFLLAYVAVFYALKGCLPC